MSETPKRLTPLGDTLRELFLKSGNLCAFPDCQSLMMNAQGIFVGQVCHIEAAEPEGERFNPTMTNEERRTFSNLMLMCYEHHMVTNDVVKYTVARMQQMKADHEKRFSRPDRAMLEQFKDSTITDQLSEVKTLRRMDAVLEWNSDEKQLLVSAKDLNEHLGLLRRVPVKIRQFVGSIVARMYRMRDTQAASLSNMHSSWILANDVRDALHISEEVIVELMKQVDSYSLGHLDTDDEDVKICIRNLDSGWPFYDDLAAFCEKTGTSIDVFMVDLEFGRLDS